MQFVHIVLDGLDKFGPEFAHAAAKDGDHLIGIAVVGFRVSLD